VVAENSVGDEAHAGSCAIPSNSVRTVSQSAARCLIHRARIGVSVRTCLTLEPMRHRQGSTSLSLQSEETSEPARGSGKGLVVLVALLLVLLAGLGFLGYEILRRVDAVEQQVASLSARTNEVTSLSRQAMDRAVEAETSARAAAEGRQLAEAQTGEARQEADAARQEAITARETAARAQAEADQVRKKAEAEIDRLEAALGQIAETRRTALGLVMNLGSDYLKFEFDKAELRQEDRELLSRIAGILLTSQDYTISVNGHTDDVGSEAYNQKLSERRATAVRDYLVQAGLPAGILSVTGHGKALPLVPGRSEEARAKNRRVELGIASTRIRYGR
jgi:outer membrane protein OmpA-like peptidoglycan-associated protein